MVYFQDLSTELLIKIFEYCSIPDLFELQKTCSRFYTIIKKTSGLGNSNPLLVTNQFRQDIRLRCLQTLTIKEKFWISHNWKNGVYIERHMLRERKKCMPWLTLTKDHVWLSRSNTIRAYKRRHHKLELQKPAYSVTVPVPVDVCKFVLKNDCVISGQQDGSILLWKCGGESVFLETRHESDINSVDLDNNNRLFVSGSKDQNIKVWLFDMKINQEYVPVYSYNMEDRIWSTAFSRDGKYLAVGTAGFNSIAPLHVFDMDRFTVQEFGQYLPKGSGILQIRWEDPFTLLTCGYDKNIRKWDIRTGACEQSWEDPFYATVYCFDTDNCCTILSGTESNGRVVLWDTRSKHYVQMYFMETCKKRYLSSPIYSLSFDVSELFTATDHYLHSLDFSVIKGVPKNYNFFENER